MRLTRSKLQHGITMISTLTCVMLAGWFNPTSLRGADQAETKKIIKPVKYTFSAKPSYKTHPDGDFTKLTDGNLKKFVVWRFRNFSYKPLDIDYLFDTPVKVNEVKVHYFRRRAYGIERISVIGTNVAGKNIPLAIITPKQPYEPPEDAQKYSVFSIKIDSKEAFESLKFQIKAPSHLGIMEIEVFGEKAVENKQPAATTGKVGINPFDKLKSMASADKLTSREIDVNGDKIPDIILENSQVMYVIDTSCGGVVNYLYDKHTGKNLIKPRSQSVYGGVFSDGLYPGKWKGDWRFAHYNHEIIKNTPEEVSVKIWKTGKTGAQKYITFEKVFTLNKESCALKTDYRIKLSIDNVVPLSCGMWNHSGMGIPTEPFKLFVSSKNGTAIHDAKQQSLWAYDTPRGWAGIVTQKGEGCAIFTDNRYVKCFYFWGKDKKWSTVEFRTFRYPIDPGDSFNITAWIIPFYGIGVPEDITPSMVGRIDAEKAGEIVKQLNVKLKPSAPGHYTIVTEYKKLPEGKWATLSKKSERLPSEPFEMNIPWELKEDGTYEIKVTALEYGKVVFTLNAPVTVGKSVIPFQLAAKQKKIRPKGEEEKKINLVFDSLKVPSKHATWAKPFAGGKPKVLFIGRKRGAIRDAIELAERFDMDVSPVYMAGFSSRCLWSICEYYNILSKQSCLDFLNETLKNRKFDCIVVSSDLWKYLPAHTQSSILDNTKKGAGLVLIAPEFLPDDLAKHVKLADNAKRLKGSWLPTGNHIITSGIPFNALPNTLALPYQTSGKVLATINQKPLLSVFNYDKGRVAATSWVVGGRNRTGYHAKYSGRPFLPNMFYLDTNNITYNYWEYQLSLLAKTIYWVSQKESGVIGSELSIDSADKGKKLSLNVINKTGHPIAAKAELAIRNKFYKTVETKQVPLDLAPGTNDLTLLFKQPELKGVHFADLRLTSARGTEWWGTVTVEGRGKTSIVDIDCNKEIWKRHENVECVVKVKNNMDDMVIKLILKDSYGRIFAEAEKTADQQTINFSLPLINSKGLTFTAIAQIIRNNTIVDEVKKELIIFGKPDRNKYQVSFGWPSVSMKGFRKFLTKKYYSRLKELGATCIQHWNNTTKFTILKARELDLPLIADRCPAFPGGKHPNQTIENKGKFGLIRNPCLSTPGFQQKLVQDAMKDSWDRQLGILYRGGPDEANSISNWDGCFSEDCQQEFRKYLKKHYKTLDALNKSWETTFTDWNQVIAMSREEVKKRHSFAPWLDHRTFNEWNWGRSLLNIKKGIKKLDPELSYSLVGTQNTSDCNAWNWYYITNACGVFGSYTGEQIAQQRSFAKEFGKRLLLRPFIGYHSSEEFLKFQVVDYMMQGASGFNIYSGSFYVNPDFTFAPGAIALQRALTMLNNGKADVIINSDYEALPIAFHYSPSSIKVNRMLELTSTGKESVKGFKDILSILNSDYDYIAYQQLEDGKLSIDNYKILVLPVSSALSDKEVKAVKAFVKAGGVLVGDLISGTYTENGKNRDTSALDEVFGIKHNGSGLVHGEANVIGTGADDIISTKQLDMPVNYFENNITCVTGKPLAEVSYKGNSYPAVITHKYGKGYAVYLGCDVMNSFSNWREFAYAPKNKAKLEAIKGIFSALLTHVDVVPFAQPVIEDGSALVASKCYLRKNGTAYILGIVRNNKACLNIDAKPHDVTVKLRDKYYVYDLINEAFLGHGDSFQYRTGPTTQSIFALLPYKVNTIEMQLLNESVKRGDSAIINVQIDAGNSKLAKHVLKVDVFNPAGKKVDAYSTVYFAENGICKFTLPIALNDQVGQWKVVVKDVMTQAKAEKVFKVN